MLYPKNRYSKKLLLVIILWMAIGCATETDTAETETPRAPVPDTTAASARPVASTPNFATYVNDRFGFKVDYPGDVFTSIDRSQNGDGAVLSSSSEDATLRVYASHNVLDETITDLLEAARADFASVASEEGRQDYAVLRGVGEEGNRLVKRIELRDGKVYHLDLSYPAGTFEESTVEHIVSSFEVNTSDEPTGLLVQVALLDYLAASGAYEKESTGYKRGCDRVVLVDRNVASTEAPLTAALEALFSMNQFEVEGWQNFIAKTELSFDRAVVENGTASLYLTGELAGLGGVCDNPRASIQLEETALQFPTVTNVVFYLNGQETDLTPDGQGMS